MKSRLNLTSQWRDVQSQRFIAIFRNFKNQSQRFMTIFRNFRNLPTPRNFKNQSQRFMTIFWNFINQGVTNLSKIKTIRYLGLRSSVLASKTQIQQQNEQTKISSNNESTRWSQNPVSRTCWVYRRTSRARVFKKYISVEEIIFLFTRSEANS